MKKLKYYIYFNFNYRFRFIPKFKFNYLIWKDKDLTPRVELSPHLSIEWLWFSLLIYKGNDSYWERYLWLHIYCDSDIEKAKTTWPWYNILDGKKSWDNY